MGKSETPYPQLLGPVLNVLHEKPYLTREAVISEIFLSNNFQNQPTEESITLAVNYLEKTEYIILEDNKYTNTKKAVKILQNYDSDEINERIRADIQKRIYTNKYDFKKLILEFLKNNPNHNKKKRKELVHTIQRTINLPDDVNNLLTKTNENLVYTKIDFGISGLSERYLIENKEYYQITKRGLNYLKVDRPIDSFNMYDQYQTYISFLSDIPELLKQRPYITLEEIISTLEKDWIYFDDEIDENNHPVETAVKYLYETGYIVKDEQEYRNTKKAEKILAKKNTKKERIKAINKDIINHYQDKINEDHIIKSTLKYIQNNNNIPPKVKNKTIGEIVDTMDLDEDILNLVKDQNQRYYMYAMVHEKYIKGKLPDEGYLEKTREGYFLTDKGIRLIGGETITTQRKSGAKFSINTLSTETIYKTLIIKILEDREIHRKKDINKKITEALFETLNNRLQEEFKEFINEKTTRILGKLVKNNEIIRVSEGRYQLNKNTCVIKNIRITNKTEEKTTTQDTQKNKTTNEDSVKKFKKLHRKINSNLEEELLKRLKSSNPYFFEKVVLDMLHALYKSTGPESNEIQSCETTPKSKDGGIDGEIKLKYSDSLIVFQAKRWKNNIQTPQMHEFIGAMVAKKASKGYYVTTSSFSKGAVEASKIKIIELIDGKRLVENMIRFNIGIKTEDHTIKIINDEYFTEE